MSKDQKTKTLFLLNTMVEQLTEARNHVNAAGVVDHTFLPEPYRSQILPYNDTVKPAQHTGRNFICQLLIVANGSHRRVQR